MQGQELKLSAAVVTTGFANKAVAWSAASVVEGMKVSITPAGVLKVASDSASGAVTVTATSIYDSTVTGTASITVGTPET